MAAIITAQLAANEPNEPSPMAMSSIEFIRAIAKPTPGPRQ